MTNVIIKRAGPQHPPGLRTDSSGEVELYVSPKEQKRLWKWLQKHRPELIGMLEHEPMAAMAREIFNAKVTPMPSLEDIRLFMGDSHGKENGSEQSQPHHLESRREDGRAASA